MNASFEIEFSSAKHAKHALQVIKSDQSSKVVLSVKAAPKNPKAIYCRIESHSFAALRARATSLLRDVKIARDTFAFIEKG
ncbi:CTAG/PCC1 family protein [Candidatus Micrarchaeota archaeon]|nr:CTAG/PCC1 family protein [Candidatus Micrarchaeota archaeon]